MGRDLRKFARQTTTRLIIGGIILLFVIGDGLVYLIYGPGPAISGLLCLGLGMLPILLIVITLWIIDIIVKRVRSRE